MRGTNSTKLAKMKGVNVRGMCLCEKLDTSGDSYFCQNCMCVCVGGGGGRTYVLGYGGGGLCTRLPDDLKLYI